MRSATERKARDNCRIDLGIEHDTNTLILVVMKSTHHKCTYAKRGAEIQDCTNQESYLIHL